MTFKNLCIPVLAIFSTLGTLHADEIRPEEKKVVRHFVEQLDAVLKGGKAEDLLPLICPENRGLINADIAKVMFHGRWGNGVPEGKLSIQRYKELPMPDDIQVGEFPVKPTYDIVFTRKINGGVEENVMHLLVTDKGTYLVFMQGSENADKEAQQDAVE